MKLLNPLNFTAETFALKYLDLKNLFPGKPDWFMRIMAGITDFIHWIIDARAQDVSCISNTITDEQLQNICQELDYHPVNRSAATMDIYIYSDVEKYIGKDYEFNLITRAGVIHFVSPKSYLLSVGLTPVTMIQGSWDTRIIGYSNTSEWQKFFIEDSSFDWNSINVFVNNEPWTRVETLVNSEFDSKHYRLIYKGNSIAVEFGNGYFGLIPELNAEIMIEGIRTSGSNGMFPTKNELVTTSFTSNNTINQTFLLPENTIEETIRVKNEGYYWKVRPTLQEGGKTVMLTRQSDGKILLTFGDGVISDIPDNLVEITYNNHDLTLPTGVFLRTGPTGGSDRELPTVTKELAPKFLRTQYNAVSQESYSMLARKFSSVVYAKTFPGYYGQNTIGLHIIPTGGGNPSTYLKQQITDYISPKMPLNGAILSVRNPKYVEVDAEITIKLRTDKPYDFLKESQFVHFIFEILTNELKFYFYSLYLTSSIYDFVDYINTQRNYTFTQADFGQIQRICNWVFRERPEIWGSSFIPEDFAHVIHLMYSVQNVNLINPVTVYLEQDEVMTTGTITISQV